VEVHRFIDHSHIFEIWIHIFPNLRAAFRVTHPDGGAVPNICTEVLDRTTVQPA